MRKTSPILKVFTALACFIASASAASAQLARTYVSLNGDDANSCTRLSPCRQIGRGIMAVQPGGEVVVLSTANYQSFTADKSVTVTAAQGVAPWHHGHCWRGGNCIGCGSRRSNAPRANPERSQPTESELWRYQQLRRCTPLGGLHIPQLRYRGGQWQRRTTFRKAVHVQRQHQWDSGGVWQGARRTLPV